MSRLSKKFPGIGDDRAAAFQDRRWPLIDDPGGDRASAVVALVLRDPVNPAVPAVKRDVRAIIEEAAPERHGHILAPAVEDAPLRIWELPLVEQALREFVPVVVLIAADLALDLEAIELGVEDEVDDTGDGVGAVDGGGAAGQHFDALDDRRRDAVDVRQRESADRPA